MKIRSTEPLRPSSAHRSARRWALCFAPLCVAACGSSVSEQAGAGGSGAGGQGGGGGSVDCSLPLAGAPFQFQLHNVGTRELSLTYGCGETLPITIDTTDGPRGIGAGSGDSCEVPCEDVYGGDGNFGCSDCGPGSGAPFLPGDTALIDWDRRVYVSHEAPAACGGQEGGNHCGLGVPVGEATSGTLTICLGADSQGACSDGKEELAFVLDLSLSSVVVDVP